MKNKKTITIIGCLIAFIIYVMFVTLKCFIDMYIYSECLKRDPQVFYNNPVCKKYKNF